MITIEKYKNTILYMMFENKSKENQLLTNTLFVMVKYIEEAINEFKDKSSNISANRIEDILKDVEDKLYTIYIYSRD